MLQKVLDWLKSDKNIFMMLGCVFEIMRSPEHADSQSITVNFDLNKYFCRLTFWDSGSGHIEVLETDSEATIVDEGFDIDAVFSSEKPFEELAKKLSD
ncbi:hypothetical protein [Motiliproteus sp. MSK22-1]|uniref:immunity protein TriTu family protein n=1 Tax=Motiliproteus sp. MSK22-1 TaxID=1897630 RepID=UPI00097659F6|nr:hypothetical protein [Motiliproteus sp. MSK22-1]OMH38973.1 hypothetical protein BGP75_04400 [Motiliproteus sp. MSK22-1]